MRRLGPLLINVIMRLIFRLLFCISSGSNGASVYREREPSLITQCILGYKYETSDVLPPANLNFPFFVSFCFSVWGSAILFTFYVTLHSECTWVSHPISPCLQDNCTVNDSFNLAYFGLLSVVISFLASDVILFCLQPIMVPTWPGIPRKGVITSKALNKSSIN